MAAVARRKRAISSPFCAIPIATAGSTSGSDLLTGLHSPFGVAWADGTLYVAATDAILAYPYALGADGDHRGAGLC